MAKFQNGWIKLWRKAVEGDLADNPILWALWNWLLYTATWKPTSIIWNGARRDIPSGTVVLGISELAEKWECSQSTVKKWLTYLQSSGRIYLETCSRGTLVTIVNWDTYQNSYAERREPSENEVGAGCEQGENEVRLIEEGKKVRREEEKEKAGEIKTLVKALVVTWIGTLQHRGAGADMTIYPFEEDDIFRAIKRFGAEAADQALFGFRFEESFTGFNAKNHLKLSRVFDAEKIQQWISMATMNRPKARELVEVEIS